MARRRTPPPKKPSNQVQPNNRASLQDGGDARITIHQEQHYLRSGPLPDPKELEAYNNVIANGAERIFIQFEKQADHRRLLENKVIDNDIRNSRLGMLLGALGPLAGIISATWVSLTRSVWEGLVTVIVILLIGLYSLYLADKRRGEELRAHKEIPPLNSENNKS